MKNRILLTAITLVSVLSLMAQTSVGLTRPKNTDGSYVAFSSTSEYTKSAAGMNVTFYETTEMNAVRVTNNTTSMYHQGTSVSSDFAWMLKCNSGGNEGANNHPDNEKFREKFTFGFQLDVAAGKKFTVNSMTLDLLINAFPTWRTRILKLDGTELYNSGNMNKYSAFRLPTGWGSYGYISTTEFSLLYPSGSNPNSSSDAEAILNDGFNLLPSNLVLTEGSYRVLLDFDYNNSGNAKPMSFDSFIIEGNLEETAQPQYVPTIYGVVINASNWSTSDPKYGVYSFMPNSSVIIPVEEHLDKWLIANSGAVWYENNLHMMYSLQGAGDNIFNNYSKWNTETWERAVNLNMTGSESPKLAADLTYDPVDKKVYGIFFTNDGSAYEFGWMEFSDAQTPTKHSLQKLPIDMVAIAANALGEIYGIAVNGYLYKFDKTTGAATVIGNTNVEVTGYRQSATFDFRTGKMYWAAMLSETSSALYEVDITNGAAQKIGDFANSEEITGLYIPFGIAPDEAPAAAENLQVNYPNGARQGQVSFVIPTQNYAGGPLTENVEYHVYINDLPYRSGGAAPGVAVTNTLWAPEGLCTFSVVLENNAGTGPKSKTAAYIGNDTPIAPENLQLNIDNATYVAHLSWDAPSRGANNGYLNPDNITYTVKRYPGEVVVADRITATSVDDNLPNISGLNSYYYTVQTFHEDKGSELSTTPTVNVGEAKTIPWTEDFSDSQTFSQFTIIDVDNDGWTWSHSTDNGGCAVAKNNDLHNSNDQDDWLITPPLAMTADRLYVLEFEASSNWLWDRAKEEYLEVGFGNNASLQDYEMVVERRVIQPESEGIPVKISVQLRPKADGHYFIGFHAVSPLRNANNLYIHNVTVKESSLLTSPDAVTNLRVEPAAKGVLRATIKFNAPTKDLAGNDLTTLTQIKVIRDGETQETIATFNAPTVGAELSYEDTKAINGFNSYIVVPFAGENEGQATRVTGYVGIDIPTSPRNIQAKIVNGGVNITWEAPSEVGVNGGYVDVEDLFYQVYDKNGNLVAGASEVYGTEFNIPSITLTGAQATSQYYILPISELGEGDPGVSNVLVTGDPYKLPLNESFKNGGASYLWWITQDNSYYTFKTTNQMSCDNDGGALYFLGSSYLDSVTATFGSGKISLEGAANPVWSFSYFPYVGHDVVTVCQVQTSDYEVHDVKTIDFKTMTGANEWRQAVIDLSPYKSSEWVVLIVKTTIRNGSQFTLDAIKVEDAISDDLAATIYAPKNIRQGKPKDVKVTVLNKGINPASDYTVRLFADDVEIATANGTTVNETDSVVFAFAITPTATQRGGVKFTAAVDYDIDSKQDNNVTGEAWSEILPSKLPAVENFNGSTNGNNITLNWDKPNLDDIKTVTEDFEDYSSWLTDQYGDWTTYDEDKGRTYNIDGMTFPNQTMPMSFILYNNDETVGTKYSAMTPYSGSQFAASFDAIARYSSLGHTADWIISPELSGEAQTIRFFARSVTESYLEKMEVVYTTGQNTAYSSYVAAKTVDPVPNAWTEYSVDLPAGSRYFAIKNVSNDKMALIVDDVTYEPVPIQLTGYAIYVDGQLVDTLDPETLTYTTNGDDSHSYQVVAVYTAGNSAPSEIYGTDAIEIPMVAVDLNAEDITVYTVNGMVVAQGVGVFNQLKKGVYVVKMNGNNKTLRVVKR